jgi:hypothetical protein
MAKKKTSERPSPAKSSVKRRQRSVASGQTPTPSIPGGEHEPQRRLGNFQTAGEHARVGGRTSGIVGQTTKRFHTDERRAKKS